MRWSSTLEHPPAGKQMISPKEGHMSRPLEINKLCVLPMSMKESSHEVITACVSAETQAMHASSRSMFSSKIDSCYKQYTV